MYARLIDHGGKIAAAGRVAWEAGDELGRLGRGTEEGERGGGL